jgi:hypothetical protein
MSARDFGSAISGFLSVVLWSCCLKSVNQNRELKRLEKKGHHERMRQTYEQTEAHLKKKDRKRREKSGEVKQQKEREKLGNKRIKTSMRGQRKRKQ